MRSEGNGPVAGIVLAAGASTRMGRNKLLLELQGETLLCRAVRIATEAGLDPVIVVLGYQAEEARRALSGLACRTVVNPHYDVRGMAASLKAGAEALPATADAAVVMLADMPFITASMVATLVQRFRETEAPLVVSDFAGVTAPPMLYTRRLLTELQTMEGEGCGKALVRRHRSEAVAVSWPVDALDDLDLPDDYERAKGRLAMA